MTSDRPVAWVSPLLYGAVLAAGLYAGAAGLGDTRLPLFLGALAALAALELPAARRLNAGVVLTGQAVLFVAVSYADGSGLSRVLFVLVPFLAYFTYGRAVSVALGAGCLIVFMATQPRWYSNVESLSDLLMFGIGIVLAIAMAAVAVEERQGRKEIARLSAAAERQKIARDIHDDLGHHLTAVVVLLEKAAAYRDRDASEADRAVQDAAKSATLALAEVRESVRTMRSGDGPFDLAVALPRLAAPDVSITFNTTGGYSESVHTILYRAAQEGITNARRHANATQISVSADLGPELAELTVTDNGHGLNGAAEGFGLSSMRARVSAAGGQVVLENAAVSGTRVKVWIPR